MRYSLVAAALASAVTAQSAAWAQCGGNGWSGSTSCVSGYVCTVSNEYYSQCLPGSAAPGGSSAAPTMAASTTLATVTTKTGSSATSVVSNAGNPLAGYSFYANPYYASEINSIAVPSFVAAGQTALASKAAEVAKVGTFVWLDTRAKVPSIAQYAADVQAQNAAGAKLTLPLVVYDLPDRDCAALASNGELSIANNGSALYKDYVNSIAASIKQFPDVFFTLIIEPDSLANMVTNTNVAKCASAAASYKTLTVYALQTLNLPNVAMYMDAGHAGWLGWSANIGPAATLFADIYKQAGSPKAVRGLVTNVSNYNAWSLATCPALAESNTNCDEKRYINALAPLLSAAGFPAHFLVDQSRSGKQPTGQIAWGDWCNAKGTGFGTRPTTSTSDPLLDAIVWVKPGGESDGTSDSSAARYDGFCGKDDSLKPAPEAGTWFQAYFAQLLTNAVPAF